MITDPAFWRDLQAQFRELIHPKRLVSTVIEDRWTFTSDGPTDQRERARLRNLFDALAARAAIALGATDGGNPRDAWLNRLRDESPHFLPFNGSSHENGVDKDFKGGWIQDLALASAEYCVVCETRAFEFVTVPAVAGILALSDHSKRKLAVMWDTLRDKQKLTDEDLAKHDRERQRLLKMPANPPSSVRPLRPHAAAGNVGLDPSVKVAEGRFRGTDWEYWSHWCSSGEPYETYAARLDTLSRETIAELESIWKGRSPVSDKWFEVTCKPAIEKALSAIIKGRIAQAREVEMTRLDRKAGPEIRVTREVAVNAPEENLGSTGEERPALWPTKLRMARKTAKLSRPQAASRLKRQDIQITADAIKKHEEGKAKPKLAVRQAYAVIYKTPERELFPD